MLFMGLFRTPSIRFLFGYICLSSLGGSSTGDTPGGGRRLPGLSDGRGGVLWDLGLSGAGQFGSELALELANDLGVGNGLSGLVLGDHLGLLVDGRREFFLCHLLGRSGLLDGLAEGLVDLGDGSNVGGFLELEKVRRQPNGEKNKIE